MSDKVSTQFTGPGSIVQDAPVQGDGSELYMHVLKDVIERAEFGAKKYGHPLRTTADADFLVNAYQEVLDLSIYLRAEIAQRKVEKANQPSCPNDTRLIRMLEIAWGVIANCGWNSANGQREPRAEGWHYAAIKWRDEFFELMHEIGLPDNGSSDLTSLSPMDRGEDPAQHA